MSSIAISKRTIGPPGSSYHDNKPAIGKLRPWTRQKVEARARVKEREQVRRAENAARKNALAKVQQQPAAQRRADPAFQKAARQTSAQIGKVFAALAGGDERTAGEFCSKLPSLMKPGTDRKTNEEAYGRNLREILDHKLGKMTDAELQAVAKGVDGITHFSSDQPDMLALAQAVTSERTRRQPQLDTAKEACILLGRGELGDALKNIQAARGERANRMDWKSSMADMTDGELMTLLEKFKPAKDGSPSAATQLLSSMNYISKQDFGTEHPEIRQTGNDMTAIVTAACDLLTERGRKPPNLPNAVEQVSKAELSSNTAVRAVLRHGFGVEVSNEQKLIFTCGRAGATVDAKVREGLASYNANRAKPTDSGQAYRAASTRVRESINMTAATAKSPFVRSDGTPCSLEGDCTSTYTERRTKDGKLYLQCVDSYHNPSFKLPGGSRSQWAPERVKVSYILQLAKDGNVTLAQPVSVDYFEEDITITPAPARQLAVAQLTPEERERQALEAYDLPLPRLRDAPRERFATDQFDVGALFSAGTQTPFFKALHAYAEKEHSAENTAFCMKAEAFNAQKFVDDASYRAVWASDAADINVSDELRKQLQAAIRSADPDAMSAAIAKTRDEIHKLLRQDTFRRFINAMNEDKLHLSQVELDQLTAYLRAMRSSHPGPVQG